MEYIEITIDDMKRARTYMPIMQKAEFVNAASVNCFDQLNVNAQYDNESSKPLPHMYKENTFLKSRYLMGALLSYYFRFDIDMVEGTDWLVAADDYDRYAGGRIFECLQRFKSNAEVRDKAYDILADYKDLESRLNREIHGMLTAMNDPVSRALMALTQSIEPDEMQKMLADLDNQQQALQDYLKNRNLSVVDDTADDEPLVAKDEPETAEEEPASAE